MAKIKYYKLGKTATSFYCPITKLKIATGTVGELTQTPSTRVKNAVRHGHIVDINEAEAKKLRKLHADKVAGNAEVDENEDVDQNEDEDDETDFQSMTKAQLTDYYEEEFDPSEDELEKFGELKKDEMIAEIESLEE